MAYVAMMGDFFTYNDKKYVAVYTPFSSGCLGCAAEYAADLCCAVPPGCSGTANTDNLKWIEYKPLKGK